MAQGISLGSAEEQRQKQDINWSPLLIVIGAAYLISLSVYAVVNIYFDDGTYEVENRVSIVLSFLASLSLISAIALVIYSREDQAKKMLVVGMIILIVMLAIRAEALLRASM